MDQYENKPSSGTANRLMGCGGYIMSHRLVHALNHTPDLLQDNRHWSYHGRHLIESVFTWPLQNVLEVTTNQLLCATSQQPPRTLTHTVNHTESMHSWCMVSCGIVPQTTNSQAGWLYNLRTLLRDGFKTQPVVDWQFRPVPGGFYYSTQ